MTDESVFAAALALRDPKARAAYLDRACPDPAVRREVEALLAAHAASSPLDRPPADLAVTGMYEPLVEQPGSRVGPYKLLQQIGEGGMGTVFMAEQEEPVRRRVALKIVKPGMDSKQVVARFEAERQALSMMDHPNIARVLDAGTTASGRPFFVMELVHGVPITEFCDANKLTPRERLELFVPVCQAIQHAHMKGVIHRDIKPSNVLVTLYDDRPVPKVIDFGVAKAVEQRLTEKTLFTQFGTLVGTFEYMSPEQAEMNALGVDTRSDVYSLGVLLYELLTGTTPLERQRLRTAALGEVVRLIREEEPPRPSHRLSTSGTLEKVAAARKTDAAKLPALVRGELDWIVMRCLEKDRTRRYETASGLAKDVERYLKGDAVEACPPTLGYRLRKVYRRNRAAVWIATGFATVLLAATAVSGWLTVKATRAEGEAQRSADQFATAMRMANEALQQTELSAAGQQVDAAIDGCKPGSDYRVGILRLARVYRLLANESGQRRYVLSDGAEIVVDTPEEVLAARRALREFVATAVLGLGQDAALLLPPVVHGGKVESYQVGPDSKTLFTLGVDGRARLWDVRTCKPIADLRVGTERVVCCGYNTDGRTVFTEDDTGVVRFFDAAEGRYRTQLGRPVELPPEAPDELRINRRERFIMGRDRMLTRRIARLSSERGPNDHTLAGPVILWDANTGREIARLDLSNQEVRGVEFLGGNQWIAASQDRKVAVYSGETGASVSRLDHPAPVAYAAASASGRRLAVICQPKEHEGILRVWDTDRWEAHPTDIPVIYNPGCRYRFLTDDLIELDTRNSDYAFNRWPVKWTVAVYRVDVREPVGTFDEGLVMDPSGREEACVFGGIFDFRSGKRVKPADGRRYPAELARFAPDGRYVNSGLETLFGGTRLLEHALIDTRTEKHIPWLKQWNVVEPEGSAGRPSPDVRRGLFNFGWDLWGTVEVRRLPPAEWLDVDPAALELWCQVALRGELGPDGEFVKWKEPEWERKRLELARVPRQPDSPFPGVVSTDPLHWLRYELAIADTIPDKLPLARELRRRAEAAGDRTEADRWRVEVERCERALAPAKKP